MRFLVTGGAGFIGSNFVRRALENRTTSQIKNLTVLDSLTYAGNLKNLESVLLDNRFVFVEGDIRDQQLVEDLVSNCDVVVHFAAESHVDRSIISSTEFLSTNVMGTQTLLEALRKNSEKIFVHVSTDEVYGSIEKGSWDEKEPLRPNSPYAASKAASDLLALAYHKTYDLDIRVTRCSNNFGPFQFPEKVIPLFITNLLEGKKLPLYGDGENRRDWLHVDDHCHAIELVIEKGQKGNVYNIGGGEEISNIELATKILSEFDLGQNQISFVPDRLGHDRRYSVDWTKAHKELGYTPSRSLSSDLAEVVDWYKTNRSWWSRDGLN